MTALNNNVKPNWENPDFKPNMELHNLIGGYIHESKENRRAKKTGNQQFDADRAANFRSLARSLVSRFKRNGKGTVKKGL